MFFNMYAVETEATVFTQYIPKILKNRKANAKIIICIIYNIAKEAGFYKSASFGYEKNIKYIT